MSKKLICLLLSLIMVLSVCLAGCSKKSDDEVEKDIADKASASAMTLSMWLMSEEPVSDETAAMIEDAVNALTEKKFKTRLELHYATPGEYYNKLDAAFAERETVPGVISTPTVSEDGAEETVVNEWGLIEIKYPTISSCQVDLFYLGGLDNYNKYMEQGLLTNMLSELSGTAEEITKYVPAAFLDSMNSYNKSQTGKAGTYAIPNSTAIGEYTYMLLSKEALSAAYRLTGNYSAYTSLTCENVQDFIQFVCNEKNGLSSRYYPIYTNMEEYELLATNLQYWGVDAAGELSDAFSVLGGYFNSSANYLDTNAYARITNLFENETYIAEMEALLQYKMNSYFGSAEDQANKKFAVGYIQDTLANATDKYGDEYVILPMAAPRLTEEDLFANMFAVSTYTSSTPRSMEILTYLNTNVEFRNLILYGIEGEHYDLVESDVENRLGQSYQVAKRRNESYKLAAEKTGNTSIAYPLDTDVVTIRDNMVSQNLDAKVSLSLGFNHNYDGFVIDAASMQAVRALSDQIWQQYLACQSLEEFNTFVANAKAAIAESLDVQKHIDHDHGIDSVTQKELECDKTCGSLKCVYDAWLIKMEIVSK
ncbi:MAG: LacI family DNA-binding transcriptional regulator [Clostridia bacterium]|nr:LacI family DNA-binding transcriptional regulator [Clostridia bacterium]